MSPRARVWLVLGAGLALSLAANVAAGQWSPGGVIASAAAPLAFFAMLELTRVIRREGGLGWVTWGAAAVVAVLAFVVSYRHQRAVALRFGQDDLAAALLPVMVDIPIAVATLALAVIARDLRAAVQPAPILVVDECFELARQIERESEHAQIEPARDRPLAMPLEEARARLADVPRAPDGTVPAARAARALGIHHTRAKPLLAELGLLRERTAR